MLRCVGLYLRMRVAAWAPLRCTSALLGWGMALAVAHDAAAITITLNTADFSLTTGSFYEHSSGDWQIELGSGVTDMADLASVSGISENQFFYFRSLAHADGEWEITEAALVAYSGSSSSEANFFGNFGALWSYSQGGAVVHTVAAARNDYWYPDDGASVFESVSEPATGDTIVTVTFPLNQYQFLNFDFGITSFTLNVQPIPEPSTGLLVSTGLLGLAARRRALRS